MTIPTTTNSLGPASLPTCKYVRFQGKPLPSECRECGLGPCKYPIGNPALRTTPTGDTMMKDWRKMLRDVGGYNNDMLGIPASGVKEMVIEIESLRAQLAARDAEIARLREALGDLSFECDGVLTTCAPSRETYNRTFCVLTESRKAALAKEPS